MKNNIYGIKIDKNNQKEEIVYTIGSDGNIPIVLLALIAIDKEKVINDYIGLYARQGKHSEIKEDILNNNKNLKEEVKNIVDIFDETDPVSQAKIREKWLKNGMPVFKASPPPEDIGKYINNYPRDCILEFDRYAYKLAKLISLKNLNTEGVPQVCSMSYIAFHDREEFTNVSDTINIAIEYLVSELVRIMKIRKININEETMTVNLPDYKAINFKEDMYPGF